MDKSSEKDKKIAFEKFEQFLETFENLAVRLESLEERLSATEEKIESTTELMNGLGYTAEEVLVPAMENLGEVIELLRKAIIAQKMNPLGFLGNIGGAGK